MPPADLELLAVHGGQRAFDRPWPKRRLFGEQEKQAVVRLFDQSIADGEAFGYNGEEEEAYCREFAALHGGGFADAVNSGTSALYVALRSLEIEAFSEVIVPAISDPGGVMPVPLMNCIPVVADTTLDSFNVGPGEVEARITPRTQAIIVAHIAGIPVDLDPIIALAKAKQIPLIEDCAQAHGATYKGKLVGTIGDVSVFSTMSGKHHATGPQGGVVFTRSEQLYRKIRRASDRGKPFALAGEVTNVIAAHNFNLNDLSAAIGRVQLAKLPQIIADRRRLASVLADGCQRTRSIRLVTDPLGCQGVYWFLIFKIELEFLTVDKGVFVDALRAEGLPVSATYTTPVTQARWYVDRSVFSGSRYPWTGPLYKGDPDQRYPLPQAEAMAARHFQMSFHERLSKEDVRDTVSALSKVDAAYRK